MFKWFTKWGYSQCFEISLVNFMGNRLGIGFLLLCLMLTTVDLNESKWKWKIIEYLIVLNSEEYFFQRHFRQLLLIPNNYLYLILKCGIFCCGIAEVNCTRSPITLYLCRLWLIIKSWSYELWSKCHIIFVWLTSLWSLQYEMANQVILNI